MLGGNLLTVAAVYDRRIIALTTFVDEKDRFERDLIVEQVRDAFRDVTLEDGIGLLQGQGLDDYEDEKTCIEYRERDEKENWDSISVEKLNECHSSLSFFDAAGMRFHLPAFLIADLKEQLGCDPIFHLTQLDDYAKSKLVSLSLAQREAVRNYLLFVKKLPNYEFDREVIETSLKNYWQ